MNCDTGTIHELLQGQTLKDFITTIPVAEMPKHGFVELGNLPEKGCERCKGTGIKKSTPAGRRIPCACTNPKH